MATLDRYRLAVIALLILGIVSLVSWRIYQYPFRAVPFPENYPAQREQLISDFYQDKQHSPESYEAIFQYFVEGYQFYRSKAGALVNYPGLPSSHGSLIDRVEGFTRMAPLMGAWLYAGRPNQLNLQDGGTIDLAKTLRDAIVAGTNPQSGEYWGQMKHGDQRIVEAADVALTLWLTRKQVWDVLAPKQQTRIARWLAQVNKKRVPDNNWHLFVVLVNAVLIDLRRTEGSPKLLDDHYQSIKKFYRGDGWFTDGVREGERFDYYNAWGIHYALYWLSKIRPELDLEFITKATTRFAEDYQYLFSTAGFPIYGRSICYRIALPVPLLIAADKNSKLISPGLARRAMDVTWQYFIRNGALRAGTVTQGYCGADERLLDQYSGQGSCLWSLRSLIIALSFAEDSDYWQSTLQPLPIECRDYSVKLSVPGWVVEGNKESSTVILRRMGEADINNEGFVEDDWIEYGNLEKLWRRIKHKSIRPENYQAKYWRSMYASQLPFCGC